MRAIKELSLWWKVFRLLLKLVWAARDEAPNRAKIRRIVKAIYYNDLS